MKRFKTSSSSFYSSQKSVNQYQNDKENTKGSQNQKKQNFVGEFNFMGQKIQIRKSEKQNKKRNSSQPIYTAKINPKEDRLKKKLRHQRQKSQQQPNLLLNNSLNQKKENKQIKKQKQRRPKTSNFYCGSSQTSKKRQNDKLNNGKYSKIGENYKLNDNISDFSSQASIPLKKQIKKAKKKIKNRRMSSNLQKEVQNYFTQRFNKDDTYFKDLMGKTFSINDKTQTNKNRPQQWNQIGLNFNHGKTLYEDNYQGQQPEQKTQPAYLKKFIFGKHIKRHQFSHPKSTYQQNFKGFKTKKKKLVKEKYQFIPKYTFQGSSNYRNNFIGTMTKTWKGKIPYQFHVLKSKNKYMQLQDKSKYMKDFQGKKNTKAEKIVLQNRNTMKKGNPVLGQMPFMGITTYDEDHKVYDIRPHTCKARQESPVKQFTFPGQYNSNSTRSHTNQFKTLKNMFNKKLYKNTNMEQNNRKHNNKTAIVLIDRPY